MAQKSDIEQVVSKLVEKSKAITMNDIANEIAAKLGVTHATAYNYLKRYALNKFVKLGCMFVRADVLHNVMNALRQVAEQIAERSVSRSAYVSTIDVLHELCIHKRDNYKHLKTASAILSRMYDVVRHKPYRIYFVRATGFKASKRDIEIARKLLCL